jgi:hypothetical protein
MPVVQTADPPKTFMGWHGMDLSTLKSEASEEMWHGVEYEWEFPIECGGWVGDVIGSMVHSPVKWSDRRFCGSQDSHILLLIIACQRNCSKGTVLVG